jgi:hypothetical protein
MTETVSELRTELRQARSDLRQTSLELRRRLETYEFSLQEYVRRRPMRSILLSAGLGFMVGHASRHTAVLLALLGGMAAGYAIADARSERARPIAVQ